jgi:hypothetical protein
MSETGRYYVTGSKSGKVYCVEPIGDAHVVWGDVNPATKKIEGNYGEKYQGSVTEKESIITAENGYKNIFHTAIGESPESFIENLEKTL